MTTPASRARATIREQRALARRETWLADQRRIDAARALTPRARAGGPDGRDERFRELDALIADERRYSPNGGAETPDESEDSE